MSFCPLEKTVEIIDGKWTVLILCYLRDQPLRFSELQRKEKSQKSNLFF